MNTVFPSGELAAPSHPRLPGALLWTGLTLFAVLTALLALGTTSWLRFLLPGLAVLTGAIIFVAKRPVVAIAWLPVLMLPPQFLKVFAYEVAAVLVCGILLLSGIFGRRTWPWRLDPIEAVAGALLFWAAFTIFWSDDKWWYTFHLRKMAMGFLGLWTAWRLGRWIPREMLLTGIAAGGCGVAGLALYVSITFGSGGDIGGFSRKMSTNVGWGNSNYLAALLVLMMPTIMVVALRARTRLGRIIAWTAIPMIAMVISSAGSRGGTLVMAVLLVAMLFRQRLTRRNVVVAAAVGLSLLSLLIGPSGARLVERFTSAKDQLSVVIRLFYWREAWRRLSHLPLGLGLGQGYLYPDKLAGENPHNYLLDMVPDLGVMGAIFWIGMLVMMWLRSSQIAREPELAAEGRAMQLTLIASQLSSNIEPTFSNLQYHFMFYWIMGAYFGSIWQPADFGKPVRVPVPAPDGAPASAVPVGLAPRAAPGCPAPAGAEAG